MNIRRGFTLTELLMVIGIISVLLSFASVTLLNVQYKASLASVTAAAITDIKSQQAKAMLGNIEGTPPTAGSYGIFFAPGRYVLFHGSDPDLDPEKFTVTLDAPMQFSDNLFPGSQIVFSPGSGEIAGFVEGQNSVTIDNPENDEFSIMRFNRYGVPIP
jgi:prepilin-type N-terminal cleavage/methylation domain-containing protein